MPPYLLTCDFTRNPAPADTPRTIRTVRTFPDFPALSQAVRKSGLSYAIIKTYIVKDPIGGVANEEKISICRSF